MTTHQKLEADPQARFAAILADAEKSVNAEGYMRGIGLALCNELAQCAPPPVDRGKPGTDSIGEAFRFVCLLNPEDKTSGVTCIVYRDGRFSALGGVYAGGVDVLPSLDGPTRFYLEQAMERESEAWLERLAA